MSTSLISQVLNVQPKSSPSGPAADASAADESGAFSRLLESQQRNRTDDAGAADAAAVDDGRPAASADDALAGRDGQDTRAEEAEAADDAATPVLAAIEPAAEPRAASPLADLVRDLTARSREAAANAIALRSAASQQGGLAEAAIARRLSGVPTDLMAAAHAAGRGVPGGAHPAHAGQAAARAARDDAPAMPAALRGAEAIVLGPLAPAAARLAETERHAARVAATTLPAANPRAPGDRTLPGQGMRLDRTAGNPRDVAVQAADVQPRTAPAATPGTQPVDFAALAADATTRAPVSTTPVATDTAVPGVAAAAPTVGGAASATPAPAAAGPAVPVPVGSPFWGESLGRQLVTLGRHASGGVQHAELRLDPPELGPLRVTLTLQGEHAQASFVSAHPAVRAALEAALPQLHQAMADAGISLGQTSVGEHGGESFAQRGDGRASAEQGGDAQAAGAEETVVLARPRGLVDTFA